MTERIIDGIRQILNNDLLTTFLIAIIPIVELRGAIPAAMTMGLEPWTAFALAWLGSAIVSPVLLLILRPILDRMKKIKAFASLANAVESGFKSKAKKVVGEGETKPSGEAAKKLERKKMLGVYLFVAFPIPLTGVWTGSAVATFLDLPFFKSLAMVWLGNLTAGAIVTVLAIFLQGYMSTILDIFFIIVLLVLLLYIVRIVFKIVKSKKEDKQNLSCNESAIDLAQADESGLSNKEEGQESFADKVNLPKRGDNFTTHKETTATQEDTAAMQEETVVTKEETVAKQEDTTAMHEEILTAKVASNKKDTPN